MMEDDFYATIKLKSGEEIFAKVSPTTEEERILLIITNPIVMSEVKSRVGFVGYKLESWLKTTNEDMFIIDMENIITISESSDIEMIMIYQSYIRQSNKENNNESKISRRMGYLANVNDAKEILEKIYKSS